MDDTCFVNISIANDIICSLISGVDHNIMVDKYNQPLYLLKHYQDKHYGITLLLCYLLLILTNIAYIVFMLIYTIIYKV